MALSERTFDRSTNPSPQTFASDRKRLSHGASDRHACIHLRPIFFIEHGRCSGSPNRTAWKWTAPDLCLSGTRMKATEGYSFFIFLVNERHCSIASCISIWGFV